MVDGTLKIGDVAGQNWAKMLQMLPFLISKCSILKVPENFT